MAIYAVVEDGEVTNIVEWDGKTDWQPEKGKAIITKAPVSPGWLYDGRKFTAPEIEEGSDVLNADTETTE